MADYYARRGSELLGPFPTYTAAAECNAQYVRNYTSPRLKMTVLLDMGSVSGDEMETRLLLRHDPVMSAVFKLGRSVGNGV